MSGNGTSPPRAALDEVAHRVDAHLALGDQSFAQQQLDVAVIARAV
jgi:hypothetical protein